MTPKLARAGPKIFDKVLAFEERRASADPPAGVGSVPGSRFGRAASCDSDGSGKKTGGPVVEEGPVLQKRAAFKPRASSLEGKTSYSQKVQSYQSKFAEELQRIKKLVGKPSLKKAYSTEQPMGKLEPIPPQVVRKREPEQREAPPGPGPGTQRTEPETSQDISVTMETAHDHQLPGQPPSTTTSLARFG